MIWLEYQKLTPTTNCFVWCILVVTTNTHAGQCHKFLYGSWVTLVIDLIHFVVLIVVEYIYSITHQHKYTGEL